MAELERCPVCGKAATVIHMVDTYYGRADFGWDAGCGYARKGDGIHTDLDLVRVVGMPSKDVAVKAWNNKAQKVRAQKELEKAWSDWLRGEIKISTKYVPLEAVKAVVCTACEKPSCPESWGKDCSLMGLLNAIPAAKETMVEVVRCKDCIYKDTCEYLCSHDENWFCGDGKRKQDL